MSKDLKNILITGMALFSTFFGAGNLIFPPTLGYMAGDKWGYIGLGFLITCIGLPLFGIISVALSGGKTEDLTRKISPTFGKILCSIIMLSIGPLFAVPRTGATTFELGVLPLFPKVNSIVVSIIFFGITYILAVNESSVVDRIGSILTPFLLITLGIIIVKGILFPIGTPVNTNIEGAFSKGFTEGYQTMDALGSIILAQMFIGDLFLKGYKDRKTQINIIMKAGIVSAVCLGVVYLGLLYIGATSSGVVDQDFTRTTILVFISQRLLGDSSKIIFGGAIAVACLTTSVGLTATTGNYFNKLLENRISYKAIVLLTCIVSTIMSSYGVESIVKLAIPILQIIYPVVIVLIALSMFSKYIKNKGVYSGAVYGAMIISIVNSLNSAGITSIFSGIIKMLPFYAGGFSWILPAVVGGIIGGVFFPSSESK
ncbi:branched-chain amino acid transport system II carrier protein [uncultured Clostridium sp.]|uniref:branched-chain amino acid transport system II carrier protein n=1 Tax=uncultured Clostridium sp. TaxID=59620 RepID=UPI0028E48E23|nr:branched-chain amino acid transport system II carrier protein [uncultured Clostridium sp.]